MKSDELPRNVSELFDPLGKKRKCGRSKPAEGRDSDNLEEGTDNDGKNQNTRESFLEL